MLLISCPHCCQVFWGVPKEGNLCPLCRGQLAEANFSDAARVYESELMPAESDSASLLPSPGLDSGRDEERPGDQPSCQASVCDKPGQPTCPPRGIRILAVIILVVAIAGSIELAMHCYLAAK
ncbi:MAG TPA: hypothetical protein VM223_23675, partial [Planctomycetota bacterium]|nr:hypothetical protein [Planctomycetota bacterium]